MLQRGLQPDFPPDVHTELAAITQFANEHDASIRDLRALLWASIDNDDSRDLDQLSVAETLPDDAVKVLIAIADVDHLVKVGSSIDERARHNTTSVYTAVEVFPMLPPPLSTDLTSLNPAEDRVATIVEFVVDRDGVVSYPAVYRALVHNHAKLAYNAVAAWLEGGELPPRLAAVPGLEAQLRMQDGVAQRLKRMRQQHGALGLETVEPRAVFDGDVLTDMRQEDKNRARELIEEFMVAANGVTARYLDAKRFPSMRRVLRSPERWQRIVELAAEFDDDLPDRPDAAALDRFLIRRRDLDPVGFPDLSLAVVKLLGSGEYQIEVPGETISGHFGLAVQDYTHSTAPNRRYPDLITQRLLKAAIADRPVPYARDELDALARHCTEQEDNAKKVERQVRKSATALLLEPRIGQEFDGIVTGASEKGTWVRVFRPPAEGRVTHGWDGLEVGDRVRVRLVSTNVERGFIDFTRVGGRRPFRERP